MQGTGGISGKARGGALALCLALALTACAPSPAYYELGKEPPAGMSEVDQFSLRAQQVAIAEAIAKDCSSVRFDKARGKRVTDAAIAFMAQRYGNPPPPAIQAQMARTYGKIYPTVLKYLSDNAALVTQGRNGRMDTCALASKEIAAGSMIGKLLVRK